MFSVSNLSVLYSMTYLTHYRKSIVNALDDLMFVFVWSAICRSTMRTSEDKGYTVNNGLMALKRKHL